MSSSSSSGGGGAGGAGRPDAAASTDEPPRTRRRADAAVADAAPGLLLLPSTTTRVPSAARKAASPRIVSFRQPGHQEDDEKQDGDGGDDRRAADDDEPPPQPAPAPPPPAATAPTLSFSSTPSASSTLIVESDACPAALRQLSPSGCWSSSLFDVRACSYAGAISSVHRAVHRRSGVTVALKRYERRFLGESERHQVAREIWLHAQVAHPSVIALYAAWRERDAVFLALEWAPGGNVYSFLQRQPHKKLKERVAAPLIVAPTVSALAHVHSLGMIHRDVKPENVLLTRSGEVKLCDFGLSIHSAYECARTRLGTVDYIAPEVLTSGGGGTGGGAGSSGGGGRSAGADQPPPPQPPPQNPLHARAYDQKVDCWSVGILAYELLTGTAPFEASSPADTLRRLLDPSSRAQLPAEGGFSAAAADFVRRATERDPNKRASMADLAAHPWLAQSGEEAGGPGIARRASSGGGGRSGAASPRTPRGGGVAVGEQQQQSAAASPPLDSPRRQLSLPLTATAADAEEAADATPPPMLVAPSAADWLAERRRRGEAERGGAPGVEEKEEEVLR
jgi:aurora kinase